MNHLERAGATSNTARTQPGRWRCGGQWRPCKRMECDDCVERTRDYFVRAGSLLAKRRCLSVHCTITLPCSDLEDSWLRLLTLSSMLSERLTGRIGPFIRTLAIGLRKEAPHVHYLIRPDRAVILEKLVEKYAPEGTRKFIDVEAAYDVSGLLDYFFRKNFLPTVNDPSRIKGVRLISGCRGMTYGYPRGHHWRMLADLRVSPIEAEVSQ